jgi:hypothetical protein
MLKRAARKALQALGAGRDQVSPAGHFPLYRTLDLKPVYDARCRPGTLVFVLPPVARGSGGIADIVHLGQELQRSGAFAVSYLLPDNQPAGEARENLLWVGAGLRGEQLLDRLDFVPDVLCLTAWMTVYRGLGIPSRRKLYFVQDFEPSFYPAGVAHHYVDHTYNLGLPIITLGPWLKSHLEAQGRPSRIACVPFPFSDEIAAEESGPREVVAVYIQPDKAQRGSELLIEAGRLLAPLLAKEAPALRLAFFGSRINRHIAFEFPCENHGVLDDAALRALLRRTRVGVCASFSNISLMPFRYLASGAPAVDMDLPNVRLNIPPEAAPMVRLTAPSAKDLARHVLDLIRTGAPSAEVVRTARALEKSNGWPAGARAFTLFVETL